LLPLRLHILRCEGLADPLPHRQIRLVIVGDVSAYQQIILEERQAWQFISGAIKVKVLSYWANQHEINVKMLTEGRLADSEWWVDDKHYSNTK
jgi:hypothetical protein